ncbi:GAF domain-containing protein [Hufsiella ginkgonis]|uniref:histidine kinase n=1 Tax=Hufsiella ginkgonis TaxID=2695274 RepID=A0A7K1Y2C3_9SPHI|nr:GAF domain-containing protein [Hufsiella ginkgonis]MXV17362.1 PAS domain-containing protein [Hufsiella ginkgonis]
MSKPPDNYVNEEGRQLAAERYRHFHDGRHADLKDIVMLASQICETPIALITLVGKDVQWIRTQQGIDETITQIPRELSFCTHTIQEDDILEVHDAQLDSRFAALPFVTGDPYIRFYAGSNLQSYDGYNVGTLCVIDTAPKSLSNAQKEALAALGRQVSNLMELDRSLKSLQNNVDQVQMQKFDMEEARLKLHAILDSSTTYHLLLNPRLQVLTFNKGVADFVRKFLGKEIMADDPISHYFEPKMLEKAQPNFNRALKGETVTVERLVEFGIHKPCWWELTFTPARNSFGDIIGISFHAVNIHERKEHEEKVKQQNNLLRKIAYIESHELRAPVSSIMGIMDLIRSEHGEIPREYLELLDKAVHQLDEKIQKVVHYTGELDII